MRTSTSNSNSGGDLKLLGAPALRRVGHEAATDKVDAGGGVAGGKVSGKRSVKIFET